MLPAQRMLNSRAMSLGKMSIWLDTSSGTMIAVGSAALLPVLPKQFGGAHQAATFLRLPNLKTHTLRSGKISTKTPHSGGRCVSQVLSRGEWVPKHCC